MYLLDVEGPYCEILTIIPQTEKNVQFIKSVDVLTPINYKLCYLQDTVARKFMTMHFAKQMKNLIFKFVQTLEGQVQVTGRGR